MMPNFSINPSKLMSKRFKIKKLQYNTYEIDHPQVKGQLRLVGIPTNILEVPKELLPPDLKKTDNTPEYVIATQAVVAFTNAFKNKDKITPPMTQHEVETGKKMEITNYVIDQGNEPWNELIVEGNPPTIIKTRTILTKLDWYTDYTDAFGAPALWVHHNTTHSISTGSTGESGMP